MKTNTLVLDKTQLKALENYLSCRLPLQSWLDTGETEPCEVHDFVFLRPDVLNLEEAEELVTGVQYEWQPQGAFSTIEYIGLLSFTIILEKFLVKAAVDCGRLYLYRALSDKVLFIAETVEHDPNDALATLLAAYA